MNKNIYQTTNFASRTVILILTHFERETRGENGTFC